MFSKSVYVSSFVVVCNVKFLAVTLFVFVCFVPTSP